MSARPIIFSAPMVRALLDGTKTQTRRVLKPQPEPFKVAPNQMCEVAAELIEGESVPRLRLGRVLTTQKLMCAPGDRLWVREAWANDEEAYWEPQKRGAYYRADADSEAVADSNRACGIPHRWRPSIHMPRWASRLTLTVTDVRVQRLQEISEADGEAEGATSRPGVYASPDWSMDWSEIGNHSRHMGRALRQEDIALGSPRWAFASYWNSLHGPGAWGANPWVVALTFTVERRNIDAEGAA